MNRSVFSSSPFYLLSLLVIAGASGCAIETHPMDMTAEVANAKTPQDHAKLADHYMMFAKQADENAQMHQSSLDAYLKKDYHGKQHEEMLFHCKALISKYREVATTNRKIAEIHRLLSTNK